MSFTYLALLFGLYISFVVGGSRHVGKKVLPVINKHDVHFITLSSGREVLTKYIRGIAQDNQGFVWIATDDGFFQYDGYTLKPYLHDPANRNSISSNNLHTVYKDRSGILWIGTVFNGLDRLDPVRGIFTHYRHQPGVASSLVNNSVTSIYQDRGGTLWFGTNGGLERLDISSGAFFHYKNNPHDPASLTSNEISAIYEDSHANFWVGTTHGLNNLDRATGRSVAFLRDLKNPQSLGHDYVSSIAEDRSGTLWVSSSFGEGLSSLNVKTQEFTHYSFHPEASSDESLSGVVSIHEAADGGLWLGTERDGLLKLDPERKQFTRYSKSPTDPFSLCDNAIEKIFEDAEGLIWLAGNTCASRFIQKSSGFVNYRQEATRSLGLRDNEIWSVRGDSHGILWIGTSRGLQSLDPKTGKFTLYQHDAKNPSSISDGPVSGIREDRSGKFWIATYGGGLNRFDPATGRFFNYRHDRKRPESLSGDLINCLLLDHEGTLWVAVQGHGIDRFDPAKGHLKHYQPKAGDPGSLSGSNIRALFEDHDSNVWVGTIGGGLNRFDRATGKFTAYHHDPEDPRSLSSNAVDSIWEDRRGALWIGTREGLNRLDSSGTFTKFTIRDGLPDSYVQGILEDRHGDLWLATYNGLSHFFPEAKRFRNYLQSDGLSGNRFGPHGMEAASQLPNGEMVFGSTDGVSLFDPERLTTNSYLPPVVLTDFLLFNKPVSAGGNSPLHQPIWATSALTLGHEQNIFTLEFAALSYEAPERNRYRYRLEGLETEWNEADSTRRSATYTNLAAGSYTFRVQGSNKDSRWNDAGIRLAITVLPPWWATWWFRSALAFCVAGLMFTAHQFRLRGLRLTAARLEHQVAERTRELNEAKESAEAAKDAAESANRAKSAFLSHMNHELRTPLNAILGFANLLRSEDVSNKQRTYLNIVHRSGEHLLGLIDDVLDVAKIEAGRVTVEIAPCDLGRLVGDVGNMMRARASERNLELRLVDSKGVPQFVETDAPKLRQMLINLLGNAVKYSERGSVTLRVDSRRTGNAGQVLLSFEVEDTGPGIAAEDQARIFEPFVQIGEARQKGTGLGLAITRQYALLLGGTIQVTSAPGGGSLFRLEMPAKCVERFVATSAAEREYVLDAGQPNYRILVVDDEPENRLLLERLLENAGFQVRTAENGTKAIEQFQSWRPHFIWMDLRMPEMDGAEAARRIRTLNGGQVVRIAAATASENKQTVAATMDDYVLKPYRTHEIFECIARHLGVIFRSDGAVPLQSAEPPVTLRPEALTTLPSDLRDELKTAVLALDSNHVAAVIRRVSEIDGALGSALAFHADRLAYGEIWRILTEYNSELQDEVH